VQNSFTNLVLSKIGNGITFMYPWQFLSKTTCWENIPPSSSAVHWYPFNSWTRVNS